MAFVLPTVLASSDDDLSDAIAEAVEGLRGSIPEFFLGGSDSNGSDSDGNGLGTPPGPGRRLAERNTTATGAKSKAQQMFESRSAGRSLRPRS